ncbi:MAG: hypothetical protein ABI637_06340 [Gemmatimonadota bacterium]
MASAAPSGYNPAVISSALRLRFVALLLALLSPGAAGTVVSVLSACPVHSSALAAPAAADAPIAGTPAAHQHHAPSAPAHSDSHHQCHCPGECCPGATATTPTAPAAIALVGARVHSDPVLPPLARPERPSPRYVLPPSTAPPVRA